ncbi:sn-glycerol-3-phosphate ABC transporter ATP-binding protein UgpC [Sinorhizobium medicae]|uniref:Lactose transport ATP-binding protein LacK n=1 Tax=Sinorhizobium medicae TaxID=110321 RepID=A0A508X8X4_9HYPH|nr:sn-glycerol-3-phosphate ABC transporter ATP-binding protein UgpC [Sinorhizobium medicae]MDX0486077.1 sn-glycerol-3-phosphate ABC transporter ATP-binding protein UgpC [Sinorhizobium medicae]MDX0635714.1 sn-glycerol-3-phosphate ABC transporter ATP-binding protein UgpC [Sinorhizobium medicae]MDX0858061.1 sn-glycerol-3-phosphate ABC transporter ATP-binding protein UgpC [Sinorhizobium medicae]MDX0998307.1 sn-glycerol-3-phosphate ABC transporter ATP-binding protein UgpC [Sinorhizobium medicae]MDX
MSGIKMTGVSKSFGAVKVIHGVDIEIGQGEFAVFVGPSGCGKSTLLRMIAGLEETTGGEIRIDAEDVTHREPSKRGVAMVFQSYALYPHLTVFDNMAFSLSIARRPKAEIEQKVKAAADILRLSDYLNQKPSQLSGGQRQRVAIGRAIVREPRVFLFDEPLSNLDAELRVKMRMEIARLHRQIGATMVYVTHDQVEAMTLADRIIVLKAGVVQQIGAPLELYRNPNNMFVAGFIGSPGMNFLKARVVPGNGARLTIELHDGPGVPFEIPARAGLAAGEEVFVGVRPEHIGLDKREAGIGLNVTAEFIEELGGTGYLHALTATGEELTIECRGEERPHPKQAVTLALAPEVMFAFDANGARLR